MTDIAEIENTARQANSTKNWDKLWEKEGDQSWRTEALAPVYDRIVSLIQEDTKTVCDIGGGRGCLVDKIILKNELIETSIVDQSNVALRAARLKGHSTFCVDLENLRSGLHGKEQLPINVDVYLCTEVIEHLSESARDRLLLEMSVFGASALISVPNNRLGPEEEPQHTIKFTAKNLKDKLSEYWDVVRIEVFGPYLLAVCGDLAFKNFSLSVCLPVRDEARDLEPTLASFRGVADEMIVGVDPRTKDNTFEIAEMYADKVFYLENPQGDFGENGINFSNIRNQVSEKCKSDWIFMTEGHERLSSGSETLLSLDRIIPEKAAVCFVYRTGDGQRWAFPWLYKNRKNLSWKRAVHNLLDFPEGTYCVQLPGVVTVHKRHEERTSERAVQRRSQNRSHLMDDWRTKHNENSLFYLGQEWRELDPRRAIERLDQFIEVSNNGAQKYQARLILAKECWRKGDVDGAKKYLLGCTGDDWSRTEHWVWLGDLAYHACEYEKAYVFYGYAATSIGSPPMTLWWIDLCFYSYVPAQRLAMTCGEIGRIHEAKLWAERARDLLPADSPPEAFAEADENITILQEAIDNDKC